MDDPSARFLELSRFWVQRVLVPILVLIGAGGNIVTVMVLTRRRMRCSTNIYLTALAVTDLIYLLFVLILSFEHYPNIHDIRYELYWRFYGINHWLADAASSTSIWLTVCFTIERYIAVCHPIRGKVLCTENRAKRVIAAVSILCILSTITTSFEYQLTTSERCLQKTCPEPDITFLKTEENVLKTLNIRHNNEKTEEDNLTFDVSPTSLNDEERNFIPDSDVDKIDVNTQILSLDGEKIRNFDELSPQDKEINVKSPLKEHPKQEQSNNSAKDDLLDKKFFVDKTDQIKPEIKINSENLTGLTEEKLPNGQNTVLESLKKNNNKQKDGISKHVQNVTENVVDCLNSDQNCTSLKCQKNATIITSKCNNSKSAEKCCVKKYEIQTEPTNLGRNVNYTTIFYWFTCITFTFLPLALIATFNCFLVNAVRRSQIKRKQMTKSENSSQAQEHRMTLILICVVILFLICQTPTACMLIYTTINTNLGPYANNIVRGLGNIFNLLMSINAACNFLLYCALSDKYRRTFRALFCERRINRNDTYVSSRNTSISQRFSGKNGFRRNQSAYVCRSSETQSLNSIPRSKTIVVAKPVSKNNTGNKIV